MYTVVDHYPSGCAYNGDFISRTDLGDVIEVRDGEKRRRPERVLVTHTDVEFVGVVCFGERTVRNMAHEFGMIDDWRYVELQRHLHNVNTDRDQLSREVTRLHDTIERLRTLESAEVREVYIAVDGSRHASPAAALARQEVPV